MSAFSLLTDNEPSQAPQPEAPLSPAPAADPSWPAEPRQGQQELQGKKIQALEESVLRLTRTVQDLQISLAGVSKNPKHAVQDDTSEMAAGRLGQLHPPPTPDPATAGDAQTARLPGVLHGKESGPKDIESELAEVRDTLKTKSDKLEELDGKVKGYEGQLRRLQEAAQGPTATMTSAELLQAYVDGRLEALRRELLEGMDRKLADLKATCAYRLAGGQQPCDDYGSSYLGVVELIAEKEAGLRKELGDLRARLREPAARPGCCRGEEAGDDWGPQVRALDRKIERVAEAARMLNARLDRESERPAAPDADADLEARWSELDGRLNATERNAEAHCFYVEASLRGALAGEVGGLRQLLHQQIRSLEDRLRGGGHPAASGPGWDGARVQAELRRLQEQVRGLQDACSRSPPGALPAPEGAGRSLPRPLNDTERSVQKLREDLGALHARLSHTEDGVARLQKVADDCRAGRSPGAGGAAEAGKEPEPGARCCGQLQAQVQAELDACREQARGVQGQVAAVEGRVSLVERTCGKLDSVAGSLQRIKEGLSKHVSGLWACVRGMNGTLGAHSRDIAGLKSSVQQFYSHVFQVSSDLQDLVTFQPPASK